MTNPVISVEDLAPFADIEPARAEAMVEDAYAQAVVVAPCLSDPDPATAAAAKAILRRAILRWDESGVAGTVTQETAGQFSQTMQAGSSKGLFWPSEIVALQRLCKASRRAFTVTPVTAHQGVHGEGCALRFGAAYCSCGADLADVPIFEGES